MPSVLWSCSANPAILNFFHPHTQLMTIKRRQATENRGREICKRQQIWFFIFSTSGREIFICRLRAVQDWLDLMFMQSMKNYSVMVQHLSSFASFFVAADVIYKPLVRSCNFIVANDWKNTQNNERERKFVLTYNLIVNSRLRDERGDEAGNELDKMRDRSPRASPNGHSPVLNLSKSGNDHTSNGPPSERSDAHSPNPSIRDDEDNLSEGNASEADEANDKDDDGEFLQPALPEEVPWLVSDCNQFVRIEIDFDISFGRHLFALLLPSIELCFRSLISVWLHPRPIFGVSTAKTEFTRIFGSLLEILLIYDCMWHDPVA